MSIHLSKHPNLYALHHTFINLRIKCTHLQLWQLYIYTWNTYGYKHNICPHIFKPTPEVCIYTAIFTTPPSYLYLQIYSYIM